MTYIQYITQSCREEALSMKHTATISINYKTQWPTFSQAPPPPT